MKKDSLQIGTYSDGEITDYTNMPVPKWLHWSYWILAVIGVAWMVYFWGGSRGWLDRGHWYELEKAAKTTFPLEEDKGLDPARSSPYTRPL